MKKVILVTVLSFIVLLLALRVSSAQVMTDDDYEKLGEELMQTMMDERHESMDEQMRETMGDEFLRQMHIAMGKQAQSPGKFGMMPMLGMMGGWNMMSRRPLGTSASWWNGPYSSLINVLVLVSWLALIAFLLAAARWFWKKGGK